jgi:hypothetical protein
MLNAYKRAAAEGTEMMTKALIVTMLILTPAPFPKMKRPARTLNMAGTWQVKWGGSDVVLELRQDTTGEFRYHPGGGTYRGKWRYAHNERTLYLTLDVLGEQRTYIIAFEMVDNISAVGKVRQGGPNWFAKVTMSRTK